MKSSRLKSAQSFAQAFRHLWLLFVLSGLLTGSRAEAQGTAFTYQGSLADGAAPANGTYDLRLTVFDAATGGNAVGAVTELAGQTVNEGLFTVTLDPGAGVFTGAARWLELAVRTNGAADFSVIIPRQALTPTPYAIRAASATTAATATVATTANSVPASGIVGTLPVAQLPASVVVNGTNGLTLTPLPELVGQSSLAGGALSVLAGDHYAGIAAGNAGLLIFDVANPSAPALVSQFNQGVFTHGFTVDKDHAYLASGPNGLRTFSLTNIAAPEFLSETNDTEAHQVVTDGNFVYVAGVPNTVVYSLTDRSRPEKIGVVGAPSASSRRLALANTTLFVAGANALRVYSVTAPASPVQMANVPVIGARSVAVSGNMAFVACGPAGVAVFDVANPASPTLVGAASADSDAQHVYASANRLYVADHGVGLSEWDVTSPTAPVHLHTFTSVPDITGSIVLNNYVMTANSDAVGLRILGLSQAVNFAAGHEGNGASGNAVGVTIGGGGARTYLVQTGEGEQNVGGPNVAGGDFSTIAGGLSNTVAQAAHGAVIAGGAFNRIDTNATVAAIGGGAGNRIGTDSRNAVIAGGDNNSIGTNAPSAFIGGGERNEIAANARGATVPGGFQNRAAGERSFAAGQQAKADHRGAFVWADANGGDFLSTAENQFSVRARGGVRFETGGAGVLVDGQPLGSVGAARLNGGNTFTGNQTVNGAVSASSFTGNGFGLTSLSAGNLVGTVPEAQLPASVARRSGGNAFEGDQSVNGAVSATSFAGSGAALTGLNAGHLAAGTVPDARLSANVPLLTAGKLNDSALSSDVARRAGGNAFLGDQLVTGSVNATSVSGNGAGLTALNAANLASGIVPDARLSANVASRSGGNAFTGDQTVSGNVTATAFIGDGSQLTGIGGGNPVQVVTTASAIAQPNTTYVANSASLVTLELPGTANVGDSVKLTGVGSGAWQLTGNMVGHEAGQSWIAREANRNWSSVASSADGNKLIASVPGGQLHTSTDGGATWVTREASRNWGSVALSADGNKLVAGVIGGQLYTSTDGGVTWVAREANRNWYSIASSADGNKLLAAVRGGQLYTSTDSGATWVARESDRNWRSVASSADGNKLIASVTGGQLYTSTDGGATWVAREANRNWYSVASSADGNKLLACVPGGQLYTSTDSGATWVAREGSRNWQMVASSANGNNLVAGVTGGQLYTSVGLPFAGGLGDSVELRFTAHGDWLPVAPSGLNAGNLIGILPDARLSANVPLLAAGKLNDSVLGTDVARRGGGNAFTGDQSVNGAVSATSFSGDGSALAALNADNLSTGTVADTRLPATVARRTGGNAFTGNQSIVSGTPENPFPQLSVAAAPTAPYGAFLSMDATATAGGKDYLLYSTGGSAGEGAGKLVIQNYTDGKIIQTLTAGGNVGLGTTAPAVRLHVKQQTDNSGFGAANDGIQLEAASGESWRLQTQSAGDLVFDSGLGSGYAYISRNSGSFNITSDARFKRDIQPLGPLLDRVLALEPVSFRYLHAPADSPPVVGFIAQQVLPLFPEVVDEQDGQYAIGYDAFGPIAIGAIQELNTKLETKLAAKDVEVAELKSRLEKLERLVNEKLGGGQ